MNISNKNKLLLTILVLLISVVFANITSASMNHMDDSKCMVQTTCNNCFFSAVYNSSDYNFLCSETSPIISLTTFFESCLVAPPFPPPKI